MEEQLGNKILVSLYRWYDHTLLQEGVAFENKTSILYGQEDPRLGGSSLFKYASPHKQWVVDSSVSGASIPTGISGASSIPFTGNSIFADWDNGRIISDSDLGTGLQATYSTKNFNTYVTNDSEEKLLFQNRYQINDFYTLPPSGIAPYQQAAPACFITLATTDSDPYALGSSDFQDEQYKGRVIVMSNNAMHIDACFSIFGQQKDKCFPLLSFTDDIFNAYGGLKSSFSGVYRYTDFLSDTNRDKIHITKVTTSKFVGGSREIIPQGMQIGFINFELSYFRSP